VLYFLQDYLAAFGAWYLMLLGGLAIAIMLVAPAGIWGLVTSFFDIQLFPLRRRLRVITD
jgi:branched-chain amino acid transport system permease protein